jgi:hypothetical protein
MLLVVFGTLCSSTTGTFGSINRTNVMKVVGGATFKTAFGQFFVLVNPKEFVAKLHSLL